VGKGDADLDATQSNTQVNTNFHYVADFDMSQNGLNMVKVPNHLEGTKPKAPVMATNIPPKDQ